MGRPYGAMLGALVVGLVTEVSVIVIPAEDKSVAAFVILVLVLLLRPQGIIAAAGGGESMSDAFTYYIITLLVYMGCNAMMVLGLNLQFGLATIINFSYYILVAVGGYVAGLTVLGPPQPVQSGGTEYLFGWTLPWPLPVVAAGVAGALLALLVGIIAVRRLRSDYLAVATLVVGEVTWLLTGNTTAVVNGWNGLTGIPQPLADVLNLPQVQYQWTYLGIVLVFTVLSFLVMQRLTHSPFGRSLRAIRENEYTAAACGKDVFRLRMTAMMIGGVIAGGRRRAVHRVHRHGAAEHVERARDLRDLRGADRGRARQ